MTQEPGYTRLQIRLHWAIAGLVLFNYMFGEAMERAFEAWREGAQPPGVGYTLHVAVGAAVLLLTLVRLGARFLQGVPDRGTARGDKAAAVLQGTLYLLTILVPVGGAIAFTTLNEGIGGAHALAATLLMVLALLHALSALFHQYVLKDRLLLRMMRPR